MPSTDPEPATEQANNASILLNVSWRAWRLLGRDCGPVRTTVLRLALVTGGPPIIERVDGKPLGAIAERCRGSIEQALLDLRERSRARRVTSRHLRDAHPPGDPPPPAPEEAGSALEPRMPDGSAVPRPGPYKRPPTGIFRCDKQAITDRIDRLKRDARPAEPEPKPESKPEPKSDPKTDAIARLAALRALHATRKSDDGAVTPFDAAPAAPETTGPPDKRSSSVFRCEREVITDRITRLKRKADITPLSPPSLGEGEAPKTG